MCFLFCENFKYNKRQINFKSANICIILLTENC